MSLRIHGNRPLQSLSGLQARPTASRVREALFNILQGQVPDSCWLDLCAGVGTVGAEALSRGARYVLGIERSGQACRVIQANWHKVATADRFQVLRGDATVLLSRSLPGEPFDFIYFDPPYGSDLYDKLLPRLSDRLAITGQLIVENDKGASSLAQALPGLTQVDQRLYGKAQLSFFKKTEVEPD